MSCKLLLSFISHCPLHHPPQVPLAPRALSSALRRPTRAHTWTLAATLPVLKKTFNQMVSSPSSFYPSRKRSPAHTLCQALGAEAAFHGGGGAVWHAS